MAKAKAKSQPKPQPRSKPPSGGSSGGDPALDAFTQGLAALQQKQWRQAADLLTQAVELADRAELKDRARQLLAASRQRVEMEGGKADRGAEVDPYLQAVYEKNRGDLPASLEICHQGGRDQKDERFAYLAASIHAVENRPEEAAQALAKAVELNPKNRIHAFHDSDFAELRKNGSYRPLFGLS